MFQINIDSLLLMRDLADKVCRHLVPIIETDFRVIDALFDSSGNIRVLVERLKYSQWSDESSRQFCIVLQSADLLNLVGNGPAFVEHITVCFVQCLPEVVRKRRPPAIVPWLAMAGFSEQDGDAPTVPPVPSARREGGAA